LLPYDSFSLTLSFEQITSLPAILRNVTAAAHRAMRRAMLQYRNAFSYETLHDALQPSTTAYDLLVDSLRMRGRQSVPRGSSPLFFEKNHRRSRSRYSTLSMT
jgi:hypothetical protein